MKKYGEGKTKLLLTEKALDAYNNTDPLHIFEMADGTYTMKGVFDFEGMSEKEVNEFLEVLRDLL